MVDGEERLNGEGNTRAVPCFPRRLELIETLPHTQQITLLRTIDTFLKLNDAS
jgi:hypothetical protein